MNFYDEIPKGMNFLRYKFNYFITTYCPGLLLYTYTNSIRTRGVEGKGSITTISFINTIKDVVYWCVFPFSKGDV